MPPEVTAVITTHARLAHVYEALASVCAETYPSIEIVIVDDGGSFVAPGGEGGRALQVLRGGGMGVGRARNLGLAAARGEFVIFLDDDDVAMPHRIACLVSAAGERDAALCFGMTRRSVAGTAEWLESVPTHHMGPGEVAFCDLLTCTPHVNAVLARTEALRATGGFDAGVAHFDDWSAWLQIADRGATIWSIPETVADWRIHGEGLSAQVLQGRAMKARLMALFERLASRLTEENARAVAEARDIVGSVEILTYDDYANTMARAREVLHAGGTCFGRRSDCQPDRVRGGIDVA